MSRYTRMPRNRAVIVSVAVAWGMLGLLPNTTLSDDRKAGELGFQFGIGLPDENLSGRAGTLDEIEPLIGIRGDYLFSPHWGWFVDGFLWEIDTARPAQEATTWTTRTGFALLSAPHWEDYQTFVAFGAGWQATTLDPGEDFDRLLASLSLGQRFGIRPNNLFRWEFRVDHTLTDDGLDGEDLTTGLFMVGFTWGFPNRSRDTDGDGVPDRHDDCPETPVGTNVDDRGCPTDEDGDGVFDGPDMCPGTPRGWPVDTAGCPIDSDRDGVHDGADDCPGTAAGVDVDDRGCPLDSDGDGVGDDRDACPQTPRGAMVDDRGCPLDSDEDGVFDGIDECPATPRFAHVDQRGCPSDGDADGVFDGIDRCPSTPPGTSVNEHGCRRAARLFEEERDTLVLHGVYFELNSARLTPNSETILDGVARSLLDWPEVRVEVGGHTDSSGSKTYNLGLSQRRADAVRDYLLGRGVPATRLESRGYGEALPIADNGSEDGRGRNRRVELKRRD